MQGCLDEEIVIVLQGEDRLAHEWVLQRLNQYYADPDLWLTYGQFREYPSFQLGGCRPFTDHKFRSAPSSPYHLKTFYAALFKKIQEADLVFQGQFMSTDFAYMMPLFEMAKDHFQWIPEILYLSNQAPKEGRELQVRCEQYVRSLASYDPVSVLFPPQIEAVGDAQ